MFVLEALLLTVATTPLVLTLYPPNKRVRVAASGANFDHVSDDAETPKPTRSLNGSGRKMRFTLVLDKLEHMPGMMALAQLVQPCLVVTDQSDRRSSTSSHRQTLRSTIDALRILELSDRVSAVMKSSNAEALLHSDPLLAIFRMFGQLHDLIINTYLTIVPYNDLVSTVVEHAKNNESDMIMIPWLPPTHGSATALEDELQHTASPRSAARSKNPFAIVERPVVATAEGSASTVHSHFVRGVFAQASIDVALFVDQEGGGAHGSTHHLFLPFFGGPDDRLALDFVAQLCENENITATVVRLVKKEFEAPVSPGPVLVVPGAASETQTPPVSSVASVSFHTLTHFS